MIDAWWNALNLPLQVFYGIGILAGLFLLVQTALLLFGFDGSDAGDLAAEHPDDFGVLSVRTVVGFFFGFGWTGVIALKSGLSLGVAIVLACLVGGAFMFAIFFFMRALHSLRASGNLDYRNAVGETATVYVTIPGDRAGTGQVEVMIQGRLTTVAGMTRSPAALAPQTRVKVTGLVDRTTLEVEPLD